MAKGKKGGILGFVLLGAVGFIGYRLLSVKKAVQNLAYDLKDFRIYSFNASEISTVLRVWVNNPSNIPLKYERFNANMKVGGVNLGVIDVREPTTIQPVSQTNISIPIKIRNTMLLKVAADFFRNMNVPNVNISGYIYIDGRGYPINKNIDLKSK